MKEALEVTSNNRKSVENGVSLCKQTAEHFQSIETASQEILSSANAIYRASQEQNAGIQQINQNIQLINQSTQENAASAEECANGSKTLMIQSRKLTGVVGQLEMLVHGKVRSSHVVRKEQHFESTEEHGEPELVNGHADAEHEPTLGDFSPRASVIPMPKRMAPVAAVEKKKAVGMDESEEDAWDKL
jgi:hypothetical protein